MNLTVGSRYVYGYMSLTQIYIFTLGTLAFTRLVASSQVTCTAININEPNGDKILSLKTQHSKISVYSLNVMLVAKNLITRMIDSPL